MPNWCEGVMKLRGSIANICRFLTASGLDYNSWSGELIINKPTPIYHTTSAFFEECEVYPGWDEDDEEGILSISTFKSAWNVDSDEFVDISKEFNIDIRIFAWERGQEFSREVEIIKGKVTKDETKRYNNWDWEVPFSDLGG